MQAACMACMTTVAMALIQVSVCVFVKCDIDVCGVCVGWEGGGVGCGGGGSVSSPHLSHS